jgi:fructosamine-3-kinase
VTAAALPRDVRTALAARLGPIRDVAAVSGGCISPAFRVQLSDGSRAFVKTARPGWPPDAFAEEARSLHALRATGSLPVPDVLGTAPDWLALQWLEPRAPATTDWTRLGAGLAHLHRTRSPRPGWPADNYIGPLPQANGPTAHGNGWAAFWEQRRLRPQLQAAAPRLDTATLLDFDSLFRRLPDLLDPADQDGASLLHGDLWSGNVHMSVAGPALVDPAACYGHREVDLAMAALFGGFPAAFAEAYAGEWPLLPGWQRRRSVYQLYFLLVHVVLFGGAYAASTAATLRAALRA